MKLAPGRWSLRIKGAGRELIGIGATLFETMKGEYVMGQPALARGSRLFHLLCIWCRNATASKRRRGERLISATAAARVCVC